MLEEVRKHLTGKTNLTDVYFVLFDAEAEAIFRQVHEATAGH
jgi:hypothetical protein